MPEKEQPNHQGNACKESGIEVKKTCCGICNQYSHCGIDAYVRDGKIIRV